MPSLEEFRTLLDSNADEAFKQYSLRIDDNLDMDARTTPDFNNRNDLKVVKVSFAYQKRGNVDCIVMQGDPQGKDIFYLPWNNFNVNGGLARAPLDSQGPNYFTTSPLSGCRFSIHYHDGDGKSVTVQHLAGTVGGPGVGGSTQRDTLQAQGIQNSPPVTRTRSYSIGSGEGKMGGAGRTLRSQRPNTIYYDGGAAVVFGYRNNSGAWVFYGAETDDRRGTGKGVKNLGTQTAVTGSIKTDSTR